MAAAVADAAVVTGGKEARGSRQPRGAPSVLAARARAEPTPKETARSRITPMPIPAPMLCIATPSATPNAILVSKGQVSHATGRVLDAVAEWNHIGCAGEAAMPTTITVKGIPEELYRRLKAAAEANHRSINSEIISRIEQTLVARRATAAELLERVRRLHGSFGGRTLELKQLDAARREGRP
jgi:hypothetical protein